MLAKIHTIPIEEQITLALPFVDSTSQTQGIGKKTQSNLNFNTLSLLRVVISEQRLHFSFLSVGGCRRVLMGYFASLIELNLNVLLYSFIHMSMVDCGQWN